MLRRVLPLREYESARVGAHWSPERREVGEAELAKIEALQANAGGEIFSISRRSLTAQNFVGTIGLGSRAVDILPKIDEPSDAAVRSRLVEMLGVSGMVPFFETGKIETTQGAPTLLEVYMELFVRRLALEWRRGRIRDYERRDAHRRYLRGKLLFSEHTRRSMSYATRFYTRADDFVEDVPLSRLLKLAVQTCRMCTVREPTRRAAVELLQDFGAVSDDPAIAGKRGNILVDRRHERFRKMVELARVIVAGRSFDRVGSVPSYAFVFDMNVVFEAYIGRMIRLLAPRFGLSAELEPSGRALLRSGGGYYFRLRPDIAIYRKGKLVSLIDTKWKKLDAGKAHNNVSQADAYQVYAYGRRFECPNVILLFPKTGELGDHVATYGYDDGDGGEGRIDVRTVDVSRNPRPSLCALLNVVVGRSEG